jgi:syntaxin 16
MSSFQGHDSLASSSILPPQWVDDVDGVNDALADIQRLMDVLQSLHASRVGSVFGRDLDDMEGKIEKLTRDITGMIDPCCMKLSVRSF